MKARRQEEIRLLTLKYGEIDVDTNYQWIYYP